MSRAGQNVRLSDDDNVRAIQVMSETGLGKNESVGLALELLPKVPKALRDRVVHRRLSQQALRRGRPRAVSA